MKRFQRLEYPSCEKKVKQEAHWPLVALQGAEINCWWFAGSQSQPICVCLRACSLCISAGSLSLRRRVCIFLPPPPPLQSISVWTEAAVGSRLAPDTLPHTRGPQSRSDVLFLRLVFVSTFLRLCRLDVQSAQLLTLGR